MRTNEAVERRILRIRRTQKGMVAILTVILLAAAGFIEQAPYIAAILWLCSLPVCAVLLLLAGLEHKVGHHG